MKTNQTTNPTTEAPNEAQAQSHPANRDAEAAKNRNAYWAAYRVSCFAATRPSPAEASHVRGVAATPRHVCRRALSGAPLLIYPNRADALLKGYAEGLAERRARWTLAKTEAETEALAEAVQAAGV